MGSPSPATRRSRSRSPANRHSKSSRYSRSRSPPKRRRDSRSPPRRRRDSRSPPRRRRESRSPPPTHGRSLPNKQKENNDRGNKRNDFKKKQGGGGNKQYEWGRPEDNVKVEEEPIEKEEANFSLSGKLAAETNTVKGVELKYNEPPEAEKPKTKWRLYVFKGNEQIGKVLNCRLLHRKKTK